MIRQNIKTNQINGTCIDCARFRFGSDPIHVLANIVRTLIRARCSEGNAIIIWWTTKGHYEKFVRNTNKSLLSQKSMCIGRLLCNALLFTYQSLAGWLAHCFWLLCFGALSFFLSVLFCSTWVVLLQADRILWNYSKCHNVVVVAAMFLHRDTTAVCV